MPAWMKRLFIKYHRHMALNAMVQSDFKGSEKHFLRVLRLAPELKGIRYNIALARICLQQSDGAEKMLIAEANAFGDNPMIVRALAEAAYLGGNREKALHYYRQSLQNTTWDDKVRHLMEQRVAICGDENAYENARDALKLLPEAERLTTEADYNGAEKMLHQAIAKDPTCFQAYNNLGALALKRKAAPDAALDYFMKADRIVDMPMIKHTIARLKQQLTGG